MSSLNYPLSKSDKDILKREMRSMLPDLVKDAQWADYFYYLTFFESDDGWGLSDSSGGTSGVSHQLINLTTGAVVDNASSIGKQPAHQNILDYDFSGRFRTAFQLPNVSNIEYFTGIGAGGNGDTAKHYGFLVVNNDIKGVCADGSTQSSVTLVTGISVDTTYLLEARLIPNEKVVFLVKDTSDNSLQEKGVITSNLPTSSFTNWFKSEVITKTTASKTAKLSFFEYTQKRPTF